ncbi:MAG: FKBP-type peptidyl-prolyl cis-trans isomerase [Candidatus Absconditabacterales bacterium]
MKKIILGFVILSLSFVIFGCGKNNNIVEIGNKILIYYTANFSDGSLFETNENSVPLEFVVGSGDFIKGVEEAVVGMKVGETKTIKITPEIGYKSEYDNQKLQRIPKFIFDKLNIDFQTGKLISLGNLTGVIKGMEKDLSGYDNILFDINSKQTWDDLNYKVTVVKLKD